MQPELAPLAPEPTILGAKPGGCANIANKAGLH